MAYISIDLEAAQGEEIELAIDYVVPNAMWRPSHTARLKDDTLVFTTQAALWQNTGEDWKDATLRFSTARASLGTEPPLLTDDLLSAKRREDQDKIILEEREVQVQTTGSAGSKLVSSSLHLPGVDDGGEVRNLLAQGSYCVPSDGQPHFVPLFSFEAPAETNLVSMPELSHSTYLKSLQHNLSTHPILAGPVELLRQSGPVGFTQILFVAPGEAFALSFGPQYEIQLQRRSHVLEPVVDPVDKWTREATTLAMFVSNLSSEAQTLQVTERIPVSEVEHVRINILDAPEKTTRMPRLDENGFCHWTVTLEPHSQQSWIMCWEQATSPGVQS